MGDKGRGKGAPKGGCCPCGGNHYESDCPITKKAVNGAEGEHNHDCQQGHAAESAGGFNLKGGENGRDGWNIVKGYNIDTCSSITEVGYKRERDLPHSKRRKMA